MPAQVKLDCFNASDLTPEQIEIVHMLTDQGSIESIEVWNEEDSSMGIAFMDDGLRFLGYFDRHGMRLGDWIV